MATELEELLGFLSSPSPQVRKAAVDIVSGLTGSQDGLRSLAARADLALPALCRLLGDSAAGEEVARPAAEALVNLSQDAGVGDSLVSHAAVRTAVEVLYRQPQDGRGISRLLVMLLVNLTQVDSGVNALLQVGDEKMEGLYVSKLVRSFCRSSAYETSGDDPFDHVGSILVNISKMEAGRKILLDPRRSLLKQIIQQFDSASQLRKKGVSGTIRNCCFDVDKQLQNLLLISEFLWPVLLLPVAGRKVYSQQDTSKMPPELANALSHERQPVDDPEIRIQALEAIYLISLQDAGRRAFWSVNGPRILQVGYEDEEDPKVMEAYEQIGSLVTAAPTYVGVPYHQDEGTACGFQLCCYLAHVDVREPASTFPSSQFIQGEEPILVAAGALAVEGDGVDVPYMPSFPRRSCSARRTPARRSCSSPRRHYRPRIPVGCR